MKQLIIFFAMLFASTLVSSAIPSIPDEFGDEYGQVVFSTTDPEYEWSQIDSKQIKVGFKGQALQLESKIPDGFAYTVTELPIDVEDTPDFLFGFTIYGFKPSDLSKNNNALMTGSFGMLFDYQDIRNYKAIAIFKKTYQYYTVKDGVMSMVKSGPVKYNGNSFNLICKRENGGVEFQLNGIEVCKLRKIELTSSYFGVFINGKGKAVVPSFIMYIPEQEDIEQSTTNT